jgi:hypothetical protein
MKGRKFNCAPKTPTMNSFIPIGSLLEAEANAEACPIKGKFGSTSKEMPTDKES